MGYVENNLSAGETVVYKAKLHFFMFVQPAIVLLLGYWFYSSAHSVAHYIGLALLILGLISLIRRLLIIWGAEYAVTNKRVILKTGIIGRNAVDLILAKCEGLQIKQSVWGRIFGFGTITVTTGGATNSYPFIANPLKFKQEINNQIG
ncbi:MAG: PH domain-containing protein [Dysgonomonas mossii]|uniref:PH domain-containing protein n=1 Tax=Dysgonomonas mossii TaxID=163665 RepID=UPI0039932379